MVLQTFWCLKDLGFTSTKLDVSLFTRVFASSSIYILIYVDDIIVTGNSQKKIDDIVSNLNTLFAQKDMGPLRYFLGIEVTKIDSGGLLLCQAKYAQDLLIKAKMESCKPYSTLVPSSLKLSTRDGTPFEDPSLSRSIVGCLQYITITRPELAYCVKCVCQFMQALLNTH